MPSRRWRGERERAAASNGEARESGGARGGRRGEERRERAADLEREEKEKKGKRGKWGKWGKKKRQSDISVSAITRMSSLYIKCTVFIKNLNCPASKHYSITL